MSIIARIEAGAFCLLALGVTLVAAVGSPPSHFVRQPTFWTRVEPLMLPSLVAGAALACFACVLVMFNPRIGAWVCIAGVVASAMGVILAWGVDAEGSIRSVLLPIAILFVPAILAADVLRRVGHERPSQDDDAGEYLM